MSILGIDFDGTCVTHEFPEIGKDIGAVPVLKELVENGHQLILYTMRSDSNDVNPNTSEIHPESGPFLTDAVNWFKRNEIPLWGINVNPDQHLWTSSPKPYANVYIDDAALGCPLITPENDRPYVDWRKVKLMLQEAGLLKCKIHPNTYIGDVDLSVRLKNALYFTLHIRTLGDLYNITWSDIERCHNLGKRSIDELKSFCEYAGLKLQK